MYEITRNELLYYMAYLALEQDTKTHWNQKLGKLSDERFEVLMEEYESEQKALREETDTTRASIEEQEEQDRSIDTFIEPALPSNYTKAMV